VNFVLSAGSGPGDMRSQDKKFGIGLGDLTISGDSAAHLTDLMVLCRYSW